MLLAALIRLRQRCRERQAARIDTRADHRLRPWLVKRNFAVDEAGDARGVDIDADDGVTYFAEARAGDKTDVAGTGDNNGQVAFP